MRNGYRWILGCGLVAALNACGSVAPVDPGSRGDAAAPPADAGIGSDAAACGAGETIMYGDPGCGAASSGKCVGAINECYEEFCSCEGKTIVGCGVAPHPFSHRGACASDAGPDIDAPKCPSGEMFVYASPGCAVAPVCSPPPPPCAEEFCGCDGQTIYGCGVTSAPYVHKGPCTDAGADAAVD